MSDRIGSQHGTGGDSPAAGADRAKSRPAGRLALAVLAGGQLTLVLDASIVNIALPSMQRDLRLPAAELSWVVNAYTLAFGGLLLLGARAGDILGHRRVFIAGVAAFTVASLAGGLATGPGMLLAARAAQGAGAALAGPGSLALIATTFPEGRGRARAVAVSAVAASAGMVLGMVLGGVLTAWVSWRGVFFVNVPIGLAITMLAPRAVGASARRRGRFDLAGALTSTIGMVLLVYGFVNAAARGLDHGRTPAAIGVAALLLAAFLTVESRAGQPIVPLTLFHDRDRVGGYLMRLLLTAAMSGMLFFLTLYLQEVLGYSPLRTGLAFLPTTAATVAASRAVPRLLPRYGPRPPMVAGAALCCLGMLWLTQVSPTSGYAAMIIGPVLLFGAGTGLVAVAATVLAMARTSPAESGATSGVLQSMQQVGGALGVAILIAAFAAGTGGHGAAGHDLARAVAVDGMVAAFDAGAVLTAAMLVTSLLMFAGGRAGHAQVRGSTGSRS